MAGAETASADAITVLLNGKPLSFDTMPQIIEGRTMVPMRGIFEPLGFTVTWQPGTQTIIATRGSLTITLQVGQSTALVGVQQVTLDVPTQIFYGRTLVPLRFVAKAANTYVSWDPEHSTVRVSTITPAPTGPPTAEGEYNPGQQLVLDAKVTPATDMEVVLEPGALSAPADVSLYSISPYSYRLILGADPNGGYVPGFTGFDAALVKAKFMEHNTLYLRRPVVLANGELIDNKIAYGTDSNGNETITSGVRVVERDTSLTVSEATDYQYEQMQIVQ